MSNEPRGNLHQSYLLRLWQVQDKGQVLWRASLQEAATGQQQGFESLEGLFQYLRKKTGQAIEPVSPAIEEKYVDAERVHITIRFRRDR